MHSWLINVYTQLGRTFGARFRGCDEQRNILNAMCTVAEERLKKIGSTATHSSNADLTDVQFWFYLEHTQT